MQSREEGKKSYPDQRSLELKSWLEVGDQRVRKLLEFVLNAMMNNA